jgi:hypothetical protein
MNLGDKLTLLFNVKGSHVQIGRKYCGLASVGWLSIKDEGDSWSVLRTTGKGKHNPHFGPALAVDVMKEDGARKMGPANLQGAWKATESMTPVLNPEEAEKIFAEMTDSIDHACRTHHITPRRQGASRAPI